MTTRSITLSLAVALLLLLAVALVGVGALLLVIAADQSGLPDPVGMVAGTIALLGATGIAVGGAAATAAIGLWRGSPMGWAGSVAAALAFMLGAVVSVTSAGPQVPLLAGLGLTVAAIALLLAPSTRRAAGIG